LSQGLFSPRVEEQQNEEQKVKLHMYMLLEMKEIQSNQFKITLKARFKK